MTPPLRTRSRTLPFNHPLHLRCSRRPIHKTMLNHSTSRWRNRCNPGEGEAFISTGAQQQQGVTGEIRGCLNMAGAWNTKQICWSSMPTMVPPSAAELEEFFSHAEESLQYTYIDKYNFNFSEGVPLPEGRFVWEAVMP